ncbi:MAG: hypothetical protein JJU36_03095 [Phycisphaeraceae bacterium]|nr:hypothetical protein [Phycisphaeraceae bacterium]
MNFLARFGFVAAVGCLVFALGMTTGCGNDNTTPEDAAEKTEEAAREAAEKARDTAEEAAERARDAAEDAEEAIRDGAEDIRERIND